MDPSPRSVPRRQFRPPGKKRPEAERPQGESTPRYHLNSGLFGPHSPRNVGYVRPYSFRAGGSGATSAAGSRALSPTGPSLCFPWGVLLPFSAFNGISICKFPKKVKENQPPAKTPPSGESTAITREKHREDTEASVALWAPGKTC